MADSSTPISLHLDHGKNFKDVKTCIDAGFTSIMMNAFHLPFEENIKKVQRVSEYFHFYGIPVEAELGAIQGKEDDHVSEEDAKTNPDDVEEFVEQTNVDCLTIAFGTGHGIYLKEPKLDLDRSSKIFEKVKIPLVMHGGSGVSTEDYHTAIRNGIAKINYYTDANKTVADEIRKQAERNAQLFFEDYVAFATAALKNDYKNALNCFNGAAEE